MGEEELKADVWKRVIKLRYYKVIETTNQREKEREKERKKETERGIKT